MPRTINDIIPPSRRRMMGEQMPSTDTPVDHTDMPVAMPPTPPSDMNMPTPAMPPATPRRPLSPRVSRRFPYGTAIVALIVIIACGGALYAFSGAKVMIVPASNPVTVDTQLTATASTGDLPFEIVSIDKTASVSVPAESTSNVSVPAQGSITIMNTQSVPQPLVTNTRFATSDGKVFRIHQAVTVPAGSTSNPGTANVTVFADAGGDSYNIAPSTFTLPGLKGGSSYTLVTAKSSQAFTGGFSGTRATVASATDSQQQAKLQVGLASDLKNGIAPKVPAGYVLIPGSTFTQYEPQPDAAADGGQVAISLKGTLTAVVFPKEALAKAIAYKVLGTYAGQPVTLGDVSTLTLTPENPDASPASQPTFSFNLTGNSTVQWIVDAKHIASAVAGKTRDSAQSVLLSLPEVDTATLVLKPFWVQTFPQDPAKIMVSTTTKSTGR